ncbi:prostaglandin reductase 1-like [Glandiceps talaboti]
MVRAKKYILVDHFDGFPKESDFQVVEEDLPDITEGEFLCKAVYLSVDPYMRLFSSNIMNKGDTMIGRQIARVRESKNADYPVGINVLSLAGWRTHFISTGKTESKLDHLPSEIPLYQALGVVGMVGMTAYLGLLDVCKPKEGETLVVNGAAGAVGSLVGQIGKLKGCRVIGFAGTDAKVNYVKSLGFDEAFNYKTIDLDETLKKAAPNGVDLYFDNVGGMFSVTVRRHMNTFGRISQCGAISQYNAKEPELLPCTDHITVVKELNIRGFIQSSYAADKHAEAFKQMAEWYVQGKLKMDTHITEGFENMRQAFFGLFTGENTGKALVKA